jgi:uncharacterized membrane protein
MLKKLTNTKTIMSIVAMVILILMTLGVEVDSAKIDTIAKAVCTILVLLGIMNDSGMNTTNWDE